MARILKMNGVPETIKALHRAIRQVRSRVNTALKKCGLLLQRESMKIVPVDTGTLRDSAYCRAEGSGTNFAVIVGYITHYAIYVHEDLTMRHKPGKQAKFLEEPARTLLPQMQQMIVNEVNK